MDFADFDSVLDSIESINLGNASFFPMVGGGGSGMQEGGMGEPHGGSPRSPPSPPPPSPSPPSPPSSRSWTPSTWVPSSSSSSMSRAEVFPAPLCSPSLGGEEALPPPPLGHQSQIQPNPRLLHSALMALPAYDPRRLDAAFQVPHLFTLGFPLATRLDPGQPPRRRGPAFPAQGSREGPRPDAIAACAPAGAPLQPARPHRGGRRSCLPALPTLANRGQGFGRRRRRGGRGSGARGSRRGRRGRRGRRWGGGGGRGGLAERGADGGGPGGGPCRGIRGPGRGAWRGRVGD